MKIGNITFQKQPVFLAPMEDVTDPTFRYMCKRFGVDMMYTEFISAEGLIRGGKKGLRKLDLWKEEAPIGIQIYGENISSMVAAAKIVATAKPDLIDLNYGCPVKKIANRGAGSGLLRDLDKMEEMTRQIVQAVDLPITVKTRLGWDSNTIVISEVAERLQNTGITALCIHGRTKTQMYKGFADWIEIGKIKQNANITIPIIGNGDIDSAQDAKENVLASVFAPNLEHREICLCGQQDPQKRILCNQFSVNKRMFIFWNKTFFSVCFKKQPSRMSGFN